MIVVNEAAIEAVSLRNAVTSKGNSSRFLCIMISAPSSTLGLQNESFTFTSPLGWIIVIYFCSLFLFKNVTFFGNGAPQATHVKILKGEKTNQKLLN